MIEKAYDIAREQYRTQYGVDTDKALALLEPIPVSLHCWQGDDVRGFESDAGLTGGGIQATGNYPGSARNADELRMDMKKALSLLPGRHRVNLHAIYAEHGAKKIERDEITPELFARWIDWAGEQKIGLDFNSSFFSHPLANDGATLSNYDEGIRSFWVRHGIASRRIGEAMGKALGTPCINNLWIPDGYKDIPTDRHTPRSILKKSLDEVFADPIDPKYNVDALESKLFGLGSECYVVGSHEFYMGYAMSHGQMLCLDAGHFHPTETISDKISAIMLFMNEMMLHVSRGVRWDSDHVVILNDDLRAIAEEIIRGDLLDKVHIGVDFFDASINRVAAWVIGARAMIKALLLALLEPRDLLRQVQEQGDGTARLAYIEELKTMPFGAVWDYYCLKQNVPSGSAWLEDIRQYERDVQNPRG